MFSLNYARVRKCNMNIYVAPMVAVAAQDIRGPVHTALPLLYEGKI